MPIVLPRSIAESIMASVPAERAAAYRAALDANGVRNDQGWEFADNEAMARAHDLFYPDGRPVVHVMTTGKQLAADDPLAIQARERAPICKACPRYGGDAGTLSVHCLCRGKANCRNMVAYSSSCPEGKW